MKYSSAISRLLILVCCFPMVELTQQSAVWAQEKPGLAQHGSAIASGNTVVITYPDGMRETRTEGNRPWRDNNPGNLRYGDFTREYGAIGSDRGFAIFLSEKEGYAALEALLRGQRFSDIRVHEAPENICLSYEPAVVKLTGTMIGRTFPGPPNYESIKTGDKPEPYWLLVPARAVCVNQGEPGDLINIAKKNIRRIQLTFDDEKAYDEYFRLLGRRVVATGTLSGSFSGHHKTPVFLQVNALMEAKHPHR